MRCLVGVLVFCASLSAWAQCPSLELAEPRSDGVAAFPLERTEVQVHVEGPIARVEVRQRFTNPFDTSVEAIYAVPMSHRAAVNGFEFEIGTRTVVGEIKALDEARRIYNEARAEGRTAALLEQAKENIFLQSIANIPPGVAVEVRFTYVELLDYRVEDGWRFTFPLSIKERFLPPDTDEPRPIAGIAPPGTDAVDLYRSGRDLDVSLHIEAGGAIQSIDGGVHAIVSEVQGRRATVKLRALDEIPNEDLVIAFKALGPDIQPAMLSHHDARGGFFTVLVQPKLGVAPRDITPRELILVVDVSGSMNAMHSVTQFVAKTILRSARRQDRINIVTFAGATRTWSTEPKVATPENLADALRFVERLKAAGGTHFAAGVQALYALPPANDLTRHVFVLTDGAIGNDDAVVNAFRVPEGESRIFPVGIASAPNASLLERIAQKGRGYTTYVYDLEDAEAGMDALLRRIRSPLLTRISIDWGGLPVDEIVPSEIPDLFEGMPLVVSGRFTGSADGQITINGVRAGRTMAIPLDVAFGEADERPAVPYLWARRRIAELSAHPDPYGDESVRQTITELGLSFSLVTAFTAFVAVDRGEAVDGESARPERIEPSYAGGGYATDASLGCGVARGGTETGFVGWLLMGVVLLRRRRRGATD